MTSGVNVSQAPSRLERGAAVGAVGPRTVSAPAASGLAARKSRLRCRNQGSTLKGDPVLAGLSVGILGGRFAVTGIPAPDSGTVSDASEHMRPAAVGPKWSLPRRGPSRFRPQAPARTAGTLAWAGRAQVTATKNDCSLKS